MTKGWKITGLYGNGKTIADTTGFEIHAAHYTGQTVHNRYSRFAEIDKRLQGFVTTEDLLLALGSKLAVEEVSK